MKKLLLTTALLLTITAAPAAQAEVIAKYNGISVTREEIDKSIAQMAPMQGAEAKLSSFPDDFQKNFVEKYIENKLVLQEGRKRGYNKNPEIAAKIKEAEDYLIQQKVLTEAVVKNKNEAKLKALYDEKYKGKDAEQEVMASHILVKTEEEAKEIKAQLDKGTDFAKLAKEKSLDPGAKVSGGDLGFFTKDQMVPEFAEAAFSLKPVSVSNPVKTEFGWHIIKVLAKKTKKAPSYEEAKPALESELARKAISQEIDRLKAGANIQYLGALAKIPAKPVADANVKPKVVSIPGGSKPIIPTAKSAAGAVKEPAKTDKKN